MSERSARRIGRGSLNGTLTQRPDTLPGLRGSLTLESDLTLKAGKHLYLVAWVRECAGVPFLSIVLKSDHPATDGTP